MIADLKPYPEYKDSGLSWINQIPSHWPLRRMKVLFKERVQKGFPDEPLLAATQTKGVVLKKDYGTRTVTAMKDFHQLKLVEEGDFVISLRSFQGGIEIAHCRGIISPAYTVLTPRTEATRGYYTAFLKSPDFIDSMTLFVTGIREGQNIDYEQLRRAEMPLPPFAEQAAIATFLNWTNSRLDRTIHAKRKVIVLLNEQKQAIIHGAVTRGFDPHVTMKPSGLPWIGEIPAHWAIRRLGGLIELSTGYPFPSSSFTQAEAGVRLLRGVNVSPSGIRWESVVRWMRAPDDNLQGYALESGDIVLGMDRPMIRAGIRAATVNDPDTPSLLLQRVARLRARETLDAKYLLLAIRGPHFAEYISPIFTGISVPHLSPEQIRGFKMPIPPLREQQAIAKHVETGTCGLNAATSRLKREIELIHEYRTRLIADVVTGKLDVRDAAARLPDETTPATDEDDIVFADEVEADDEEVEE